MWMLPSYGARYVLTEEQAKLIRLMKSGVLVPFIHAERAEPLLYVRARAMVIPILKANKLETALSEMDSIFVGVGNLKNANLEPQSVSVKLRP
jgi:hypothetical protein